MKKDSKSDRSKSIKGPSKTYCLGSQPGDYAPRGIIADSQEYNRLRNGLPDDYEPPVTKNKPTERSSTNNDGSIIDTFLAFGDLLEAIGDLVDTLGPSDDDDNDDNDQGSMSNGDGPDDGNDPGPMPPGLGPKPPYYPPGKQSPNILASRQCIICGHIEPIQFRCRRCGQFVCGDQRIPEMHNCPSPKQSRVEPMQYRHSEKLVSFDQRIPEIRNCPSPEK